MARHIIHLAVKSGSQPLGKTRFSAAEIDSRHASIRKAEFLRPSLDAGLERYLVERVLFLSAHLSNSHSAADDSPPDTGLSPQLSVQLDDAAATEAFGASLAPAVSCDEARGIVIWLTGELGAGKTTTTRGLLRALGHTGNVKSPTYTLLEPYTVSRISLYHFDFYRFNQPDEFLDAGLDEYFAGDGVCLVEWADKALPYVPQPDIELRLSVQGDGRLAELCVLTERGRACLTYSSLMTDPKKDPA
jgi:tRNA threonylcarbamoyladenosine biosynthesis protein TsaE